MTWTKERLATAALSSVRTQSELWLDTLVESVGVEQAWNALLESSDDLPLITRARTFDVDEMVARTQKAGARVLMPGDREWPRALDDLDSASRVQGLGGAPLCLWAIGGGQLDQVGRRCVSIVGSRASTEYGSHVANDVAFDLAEQGYSIVSGGAYGIDSAAHKGALSAGGVTVAFLAGGVDDAYPRGNASLFEAMKPNGIIVSEVPPGARPTRAGFLVRNRLIAALGMGTVLVEASIRSGARNTATWANLLMRPVMAVPGSVHSPTSKTPHRLVRDGEATLVTSASDITEIVGPLLGGPDEAQLVPGTSFDELGGDARIVCEALPGVGSINVGDLAAKTGIPVGRCFSALGELLENKFASARGDGSWGLVRASARPIG